MEAANLLSRIVKVCAVQWLILQLVGTDYLPVMTIGNMDDILFEEKIIPDILTKVPIYIAEVSYNNETIVSFGNRLPKAIYENPPVRIRWVPDCLKHYTIIFTDADAYPDRPLRERKLLIIGNILGQSYEIADKLVEYAAPEPKKGSGVHRIVTVIFEQDDKIDFKDERIISMPFDEHRNNFSTLKFVEKYNLGDPNAANFFTVEYEGK